MSQDKKYTTQIPGEGDWWLTISLQAMLWGLRQATPKYHTMARGVLWIKVTWQAARRASWPSLSPWVQEINLPCERCLPTLGRLRETLITRAKRSRAKTLIQYKHLTDLLPKPRPRLDSPRMNTPTLLSYLSNEHFFFLSILYNYCFIV